MLREALGGIKMPFFTIFTPTYNRAYILSQLYQSLCVQTCKDFEWLIIDDGSKDNTSSLVKEWISECKKFPIRYYSKVNSGKPRAINDGVKKAKGKYFFMVDSDDRLKPDAIEKMRRWCQEIDEEEKIIGVGAARGYPNDEYIKGVAPYVNQAGWIDATNLERQKYNLDADMCEAYKIELFKRFPMAEWKGEKFAPEQIALNEIALAGYKVRWHSDIIYICEYLNDGLTKGSKKLEKNNPMGYAMMYNHMLKYPSLTRKRKLYIAAQHIALSIYGRNPGYIWKSNQIKYTVLMLPIGVGLAIRRKRQLKEV